MIFQICDSDHRILNVNPKFGGANHDSFIWENSMVNNFMRNLHQNHETVWLLGKYYLLNYFCYLWIFICACN